MATPLTSKSIGNPDNAFIWYLHSGGNATNTGAAALASGFQVALGDGAETPLWLGATGIGIRSAGGFVSKISSAATAARDVVIQDGAGALFPALTSRLSADVSSIITAPATVDASNFKVLLAASTIYEFEIFLICSSTNASVAPQFRLLGPTETEYVYYEVHTNEGGAYKYEARAWGAVITNAQNPPAANAPYHMIIRGVCKTTTPSTNVLIQLASETTASVSLKAGSTMRFTAL